jgi:hypothetical protein
MKAQSLRIGAEMKDRNKYKFGNGLRTDWRLAHMSSNRRSVFSGTCVTRPSNTSSSSLQDARDQYLDYIDPLHLTVERTLS